LPDFLFFAGHGERGQGLAGIATAPRRDRAERSLGGSILFIALRLDGAIFSIQLMQIDDAFAIIN